MRRIVWAAVILIFLAVGWLAVASAALTSAVQSWFDARQQEGWQAELTQQSVGGYPARIESHLTGISLADPDTGVSVEVPDLVIGMRALWPGDATVNLPKDPIILANPNGRQRLLVTDGAAQMELHPGTALELERMFLRTGPLRLEDMSGARVLGGTALDLTLAQSAVPETYELNFDLADFTPGEHLRTQLAIPDTWPVIFETLAAQATVRFDRPIDRLALEDRRPQPMQIDLHLIEAHWGDTRVKIAGMLERDPGGFAQGDVVVKAENWQQILDIAQSAGLIPQGLRRQAEAALGSLASATGRTNELDVTLTFRDGFMRIGFLPIAPAPSMVVR